MEPKKIESLIISGIPGARVKVDGGGDKYRVEVISESFNNLSRVQRHQAIYATVQDYIQSGQLHALSIEALTPEEVDGS